MFTYAAGRCLSVLHDTSLLLDISWYVKGDRPFLLSSFDIRAQITEEDRSGAADGEGFNQEHWEFYPEFTEYSGYKFLSGWWQSERFFEPISALIRQELSYLNPTIETNARARLRARKGDRDDSFVCVHCRRGDYVSLAASGKFTLLGPAYYKACASRFSRDTTFLVFSDDPQWCRENLHLPRMLLCEEEDTLLSFAMMQKCDHYIISNSSFGWWAAWLGETDDTRIISPPTSRWFGPELAEKFDTKDVLPPRWEQLSLED